MSKTATSTIAVARLDVPVLLLLADAGRAWRQGEMGHHRQVLLIEAVFA
jgi:hypothetical protein